jgi:hypothetical protein
MSTRVRFAYPPELVHRPIIYELSKKFDLVINIHQASTASAESGVEIELIGALLDVAAGLGWLRRLGRHVARVDVPPAKNRPEWRTLSSELSDEPGRYVD